MARILLIANYGWARSYHAYQLSDGEHLVRSTGFTPQLTEKTTSFQPEVIVADLSGERPPADLLWQTVAVVPEASLAVIYSPDAVSWGVFFPLPIWKVCDEESRVGGTEQNHGNRFEQ